MHEGFSEIPREVKPVGPSLGRMAINFARKAPKIIRSGAKHVSNKVYEERLYICRHCENWDDDGNLGFGKCLHPSCGCTKAMLKLSVSKCPIEKWGQDAN